MSFCFSPRKCQATYAMHKRISCSIVDEPVGCSLLYSKTFSDTFKLLMHLIYHFVNYNREVKTGPGRIMMEDSLGCMKVPTRQQEISNNENRGITSTHQFK